MTSRIRLLSEFTVNRIAAGEVIERPAAAVKELVENALDAGAHRISVALSGGGIDRIEVTDDGSGMSAEELGLCVLRHATSKLTDDNLIRIATLGFRGEALPSIGAAARLEIVSRRSVWRPTDAGPSDAGSSNAGPSDASASHASPSDAHPSDAHPSDAGHANTIAVEGGAVGPVTPAAGAPGTRIVVRDLFFATPARRKFLKAPRTEAEHAEAAVRRLAIASPGVAFRFENEGRVVFDLPAQERVARVAALFGPEAAGAMRPVRETRGEMVLSGYMCAPSVSRMTGAAQSLVVNGRPVADPVLKTAVRVAYRDVIAHGRHPVVALWLDLPPEEIDVNVHPAKTELRFRDAAAVRSLTIGALSRVLAGGAGGDSAGGAEAGLGLPANRPSLSLAWSRPAPGRGGIRALPLPGFPGRAGWPGPGAEGWAAPAASNDGAGGGHAGLSGVAEAASRPDYAMRPDQRPHAPAPTGSMPGFFGGAESGSLGLAIGPAARTMTAAAPLPEHPLGAAVAQVLDTYILAVAADGTLILVDQHAAHERLTHEAIRTRMLDGGAPSQPLLLPAVVDLPQADAARLLGRAEDLARLGLEIESFGPGAVLVRALPAALGAPEPAPLIRDIADELTELDETVTLAARLDAVIARMACHGSIRAGRRLGQAEMDALLRQMEATPRAATCSHGRPTYLRLSKAEIETLFGRR